MRRNIYLLLAFLLVGVVQVRAQQIAVISKDGSEAKFEETKFELSKITFSNGKMFVHYDGVVKGTYNIKDIARVKFYERDDASVGSLDAEQGIEYRAMTEELIVRANLGAEIKIYRACGACVLSQVQTIAAPVINIAHLPAGVYVAVVGSETLKFVKQ